MDEPAQDTGIGSGISEVLEAAYRELSAGESIGSDLDDIFWASINTHAGSSTNDSLDSTFFNSIVEGEDWSPKQQDLSSFEPPSGEPVLAKNLLLTDKDKIIDQVAEYAIREADKYIHQSSASPDSEGDYLLFTDGEDDVYFGRPEFYGKAYDNPKEHMKNLLEMFYRGNQQELEQVAQQIITNALKGTPVDVSKWIRR